MVAGLFGLGGALVGATISTVAIVWQQRDQTRKEQNQRIEDRGRAVGEQALSELFALRRHLLACTESPIPDENQPWRRIAHNHMDEAESALALMPGAKEVRARVTEALKIAEAGVTEARREQTGSMTEIVLLGRGTDDSIEILAAYMRGEQIPEPSTWVLEQRRGQASRPPGPGGWGPADPPP